MVGERIDMKTASVLRTAAVKKQPNCLTQSQMRYNCREITLHYQHNYRFFKSVSLCIFASIRNSQVECKIYIIEILQRFSLQITEEK